MNATEFILSWPSVNIDSNYTTEVKKIDIEHGKNAWDHVDTDVVEGDYRHFIT